MSDYIYNDEDNVPMNDDAWSGPHNPTVYLSRAEMQAEEALPFTDPPEDGCWNCTHYDGDRCDKDWNNADEDYYVPDRDDHEPNFKCDYFVKEKN